MEMKMRVPFIAGNWKMNTSVNEAVDLVTKMKPELDKITGVEKAVCPPFISLVPVKNIIKDSSIKLGAQNAYFMEKGAYTGEISPVMLAGLCDYAILGHSERRQYFNENGEMLNKKIRAVVKAGIKPILCVGERLEQNEAGQTENVIGEQLLSALDGIDNFGGLVVAYEPVWAIGTGKAASGAQANGTIRFIRETLVKKCGEKLAKETRILYGGSVTPENTVEFMRQLEIDGALVGGASLKADQFIQIVRSTADIAR
jgi:triosephosphate isomerase (TIM)